MSRNYCTLATLSQSNFRELCFKYHGVLDEFKEKIFDYNDKLKLFKEKTIASVPFFNKLDDAIKHEVIFSFK